MKRTILFFALMAAFSSVGFSQSTRYIIRLKDKGTSPYTLSNPSAYLTARAIQRRTRYNIAIDSTDMPITPRYIDSIRLSGAVSIINSSKWLNQVAILTTDAAALAKISTFPFVIGTTPIAAFTNTGATNFMNKKLDVALTAGSTGTTGTQGITDFYGYGQSYPQIHIHNGEFLHNRGFRGQGMQLAMLDAGFNNYLTIPTFDSIRNNNQILGVVDFVTGDGSVTEDHPHGTNCLSTIAANMPGVFVGTAPKASFYLYRTEDAATEYPIEEQNWAAAIERADSLGIDICSTSLGYNQFDNPAFNHTYADMDGNTTIIAKAADMAAKKGILVLVAAGNEGASTWHYITTPADADSVLTVGAVDINGVIGSFSSYGPSSDGQIKPGIASVGVNTVVANSNDGQPIMGSGTSFATPNIAGLTTCLWQAFPEVNNMNIINTIEQAANRTANPDDRTGYGIPDMKKAFVMLIKQLYTKQFAITNCKASFQWNVKTDSVINVVVERKLTTDNNYVAVSTQNSTGAFTGRNFTYNDDLSAVTSITIKYRLKMNIAADTSFYLDSVSVAFAPKPNLGADKVLTKCSDSTINLTTLYSTTGLTTAWTLNAATVANPAAINASGVYQLVGNTTSGCADTALVNASFIAKPNLGADKTAGKCTDSSYNLTTLFSTNGLTAAWAIGGAPVVNPSAVTVTGTYQLIVVNGSGCSDTALVTLSNDASLCPPIIEKITISPNPVVDKLNIAVTKKTAATIEIIIHNILGQKVYSNTYHQPIGLQTYTIPMKQMASGIYYIVLMIDGKKEAEKKIMNR